MGKSMKTYQMLIDYYKAIEDSSAKMLDAARAEDWDEVVLIEQLRHKARSEELLPEQRLEKTRIMQRILQNDAQIRYLAEPWLAHCERKFEGQRQMLH